MKLIMVSPKNRTAYNFRGDLIREIIDCGYEVVVTGPNHDNVEKIEALGARFVEIPMNKNGVDPFADLKYQKVLYELFCKEKPDVVFGYTSKPVIYGSIAAKKAGVQHIAAMVTGAGYAFTAQTAKARLIRMIQSVLYKKAFRCADVVIFQNNDDRMQFVEMHLVNNSKCVVVNGSGVNTDKFPIAPLPEKPAFFMLSRVMYSKGVREYLAACKRVKKNIQMSGVCCSARVRTFKIRSQKKTCSPILMAVSSSISVRRTMWLPIINNVRFLCCHPTVKARRAQCSRRCRWVVPSSQPMRPVAAKRL